MARRLGPDTVNGMSEATSQCRCLICHGENAEEIGVIEQQTIRHVQEHGWSVMKIPADAQGPGFAYTIGLWHSYRSPELAMFGLDVEPMHVMLNALGDKAATGAVLDDGQQHSDIIDGLPIALKAARGPWFSTFFGRALAFYQRPPLRVLQVLWPDADGRFLWHPESSAVHRASQPQLWLNPTNHPVGVWTDLFDD